ncbi:MAG TPA: hypothetical protein VMY35_04925 [Phycisphaerae bacterium]|nr:hypothetical protein [Thermoguttaceae bacterium]HUX00304.1 hypothetical protein [Phycisphaerae bacterium]
MAAQDDPDRALELADQAMRGGWDVPAAIRQWAPRAMAKMAVDDQVPWPQRFRALELVLRMIRDSPAGPGAQPDAADTSAADELDATRAQLLPLGLGTDDDSTSELARRAVLEILNLRGRLPPPQGADG